MYQSQYTGGEIDESIGKVQDVFVKKTSILPVEIGGTGQTTIDGLKNMLGIGQGQDILPIANGGTGATTAADARSNLGVTPGNIGAVSKAGDTMTGSLGISKDAYPQVWLKANNAGKKLMLQQDAGAARLYTFTTDDDTTNCRVLLLSDAGSKGDVKNALSLLDKVNGTDTVYPVLTTANAANQIQSLLQGGSISVVKSIQRGTQSVYGKESSTITINAVNVNKAFVITNQIAQTGEQSSDSGTREYGIAGAYLDSSTSLIIRNSSSDTGTTVFWQVVEFY